MCPGSRVKARSCCGWCDHGVGTVLIAPFTGLSPRDFRKLITSLRREGAERTRPGRPWSLPLEDRVLLVAAYWRTNLTLRQLAPLFGISKSSADRIIDHIGPQLALKQRQRFRRDTGALTAPSCRPAITPSPSSPRTTATQRTTRSSSMPILAWSSRSDGQCPATATTARRGPNPGRSKP